MPAILYVALPVFVLQTVKGGHDMKWEVENSIADFSFKDVSGTCTVRAVLPVIAYKAVKGGCEYKWKITRFIRFL